MTVLITYILFAGGAATLLQVNSYQHKIFLPPQKRTNAFELHRLSANNSSWRKRELFGMEKVTFICPIKICSGLAEQGCATALPFPRVEQDRTGCLPKEQLNTNLEDSDPSLPKCASTITARRSCQRYFQTKVKCIPSSLKPC